VGPNGEQVGIVRIEDALRLAAESELDLVEVAATARPPVARLMDYGKFKYESAMKARETRRNQTNVILKEQKFRPKIDTHDYDTKKRNVERFLHDGDKVKVTIMFRGREQSRPELGFRLLQRLATDVADLGTVESSPKQDGRNMIMVLGPTRKKTDAKAERDRVRAERNAVRDVERDVAETAAADRAGAASAVPVAEAETAVQAGVAEPSSARPTDTEPDDPSSGGLPGPDPDGPGASVVFPTRPARPAPVSRPDTNGSSESATRYSSSSRGPVSGPSSRPSRPAPSGTTRPSAPSRYGASGVGSDGSGPSGAPRPASSRPATSRPDGPAPKPAPGPGARPSPSAADSATPGRPGAVPRPTPARPGTGPRPTPAARPSSGARPSPGSRPTPGSPTPGSAGSGAARPSPQPSAPAASPDESD